MVVGWLDSSGGWGDIDRTVVEVTDLTWLGRDGRGAKYAPSWRLVGWDYLSGQGD